ncbi:MAG: FAD-dependent oxidoreductase [Candidatus Omnitrophica bacterium]|nr:FAD-dependent oxidoreductase [Candidatus Omnitrophota bacterium]
MPNELGTPQRPLRVAIVGSGPSGFYAAESLLKTEHTILVNMFERLPAPYGLVRYGVAPDHQKIKNVIKVYEKTALHENFTYFGNVKIGKDINLHQLRKFHDAVIFATGAETDRKLGIDGEDLPGNHTATEFVGWYNGHPDYRHHQFDLSCEVAVIIGQGNVAMDVARILCKTIDELKDSDISQHALDVLAQSKVKEVHMIGRRGPIQAAFTPVEIREFGELADCETIIKKEDLELNFASQRELEAPENAPRKKNYQILQELAAKDYDKKNKKFVIHFRESPAAIAGKGKVEKVFIEKNKLIGDPGKQKSQGTGEKYTLECGIVFRSVGYRGLPLKGLPFHDQWGIIPNNEGRVEDSEHNFPGLYTVGWIKRGPSGVIGSNKPDADETVKHLLEDMNDLNPCKNPNNKMLTDLMDELSVKYISFEEWKKIDAEEILNGEKVGKPREKFTTVEEMLKIIGK